MNFQVEEHVSLDTISMFVFIPMGSLIFLMEEGVHECERASGHGSLRAALDLLLTGIWASSLTSLSLGDFSKMAKEETENHKS